jgi:hypothetical protein
MAGLILTSVYASVSNGTVNAAFKTNKICQDAACTTALAGIINWAPTGYGITIEDAAGVDGTAWGNTIGWITMDPSGPEGVVINPTTGALSGYAWSQGAGWINFSPTGYGVSINNAGEFTGYAWTGGASGGWIKFDCADSAACVKTDWRPIPARTTPPAPAPVSSGGGSVVFTPDLCVNLPGNQNAVPTGYTLDTKSLNTCILNQLLNNPKLPNQNNTGTSTVKNLPSNNIEPEIILDGKGNVKPNTNSGSNVQAPQINNGIDLGSIDYCPNVDGVQPLIPDGVNINERGECVYSNINGSLNQVEEAKIIIKYPFIPKALELPIPTPLTERGVDIWSILLTTIAIIGFRRLVLKAIFKI